DKINVAIARMPGGNSAHYARDLKPIPAEAITLAFAKLQGGDETRPVLDDLFSSGWQNEINGPLKVFWQRPELQMIHLVRFLIQLGALKSDREHDRRVLSYGFWLETLLPVYHRMHPEVGLRELGAAFAAAGLDPRRIGAG